MVNGQKVFTTGAHDADYIWLACRTDPDAPRHKGISILIVDTTDPGFSWTPIITHDGAHHVNATYYSRRAGAGHHAGRRGERGLAAGHHPAQPRAGDARPGGPARGRCTTRVRGLGRGPGRAGGRPLLSQPDVRRALAESYACAAGQRAAQLAGGGGAHRSTWPIASATKVFHSERLQDRASWLEEIVGRYGDPADPATAELARWLDLQAKRNTVLTFGGGVNEIQRELIATAGLGLPRVPRWGGA